MGSGALLTLLGDVKEVDFPDETYLTEIWVRCGVMSLFRPAWTEFELT